MSNKVAKGKRIAAASFVDPPRRASLFIGVGMQHLIILVLLSYPATLDNFGNSCTTVVFGVTCSSYVVKML
jgi:hypothetical protein